MTASVIWPGQKGVKIESRKVPSPSPGELKVRVEASSLCGTDLHIASGEYPFARPSVTLGHEFAESVVEVGTGVEGSTWESGWSWTPTSRAAPVLTVTARAHTSAKTLKRSASP